MFHSLFSRLVALLALLATAGLQAGCCANDVCAPPNERADAITLRFATGADTLATGHSFGQMELDTLIIQRSPLPYRPTTRPEIVVLLRTPAQRRDSVVLNNNAPFTQAGTAKLDAYRYVVQYLKPVPRSKPVPTTVLVVDSVQLDGRIDGNGCCSYYHNTKKVAFLNSNPIGRDLGTTNRVTIARP